MAKEKKLTDKQMMAIELLTCGKGLSYKAIAEAVDIDPKQLWRWRNEPEYSHFQTAIKKINDEKWFATVEAARESALRLCTEGNQRMVEFILKNEGYNPTQKIEAEVNTDINITIEE